MNKKNYILIVGSLALLILVIFILGLALGWFKKDTELKLVQGQGDYDKLPNGNVDKNRYRNIAKTAKELLSGITYQTGYFAAVADQLLNINYNELRIVSNIYAAEYSTKDTKTLRALIQDEYLDSLTGLDVIPCRQSEKAVLGSNCWKQEKIIQKLNYINA
jgi:hypothetical protein